MSEANTPTSTKTPIRRLGLARSIRKAGSVGGTDSPNTPTSTPNSRDVEITILPDSNPNPDAYHMRPIKSTCSDGASDQEDNGANPAPVTPINSNKSSSKKTRLSLSQSWRNRIAQKKQLPNIKRRKLMEDVEKSSDRECADNAIPHEINPAFLEPSSSECSTHSNPPSNITQQIQEVKESISIWRAGCIAALNDLQGRRGAGDMETLLNMLQIPLEIVNFDRETQEFLDPD